VLLERPFHWTNITIKVFAMENKSSQQSKKPDETIEVIYIDCLLSCIIYLPFGIDFQVFICPKCPPNGPPKCFTSLVEAIPHLLGHERGKDFTDVCGTMGVDVGNEEEKGSTAGSMGSGPSGSVDMWCPSDTSTEEITRPADVTAQPSEIALAGEDNRKSGSNKL